MNTLKDGESLAEWGCSWTIGAHMGTRSCHMAGLSVWSRYTHSSCAAPAVPSAGVSAPKGPGSLFYFQTLMPTWQVSSFRFSWLPARPFCSQKRREPR